MSDDIADLVIGDIRDRKKVGMANYGHALKANNGRNALRDLYEELIDAAQYCKQELIERNALRDELARVRFQLAAAVAERDAAVGLLDEYRSSAAEMIDIIEGYDEEDLLELDDDKHPPSSISVGAEMLREDIAAHEKWLAARVSAHDASPPEPKEQTGDAE